MAKLLQNENEKQKNFQQLQYTLQKMHLQESIKEQKKLLLLKWHKAGQ